MQKFYSIPPNFLASPVILREHVVILPTDLIFILHDVYCYDYNFIGKVSALFCVVPVIQCSVS